MRRLLIGAAIASLPAGALAQSLAPGTIKLLSKNPVLVDAASSDPFVQISDTQSARYLIVGPATLQGEVRVGLDPAKNDGPPTLLEIELGGKPLKKFQIKPRAGTDLWKDKADTKPAAPVIFAMEIDPGPHAYEFKIGGNPKGGALLLVPQAKAKRPLPPNSPMVPAKIVTAIVAATPAGPTPTPTPKPKTLDEIKTGGGSPNELTERYHREVALLAGVQLPGDPAFRADGSITVEARWAVAHSLGAGLSIGHWHYGGITPADPHRALPRQAINVDVTPVFVHATWYAPLDGVVRPYACGGPGFTWAMATTDTHTSSHSESRFGPAADAALGVEFDMGRSDLKEGQQKIIVELRESWSNVGFAANDYKDFSSTQVFAGAAFKF